MGIGTIIGAASGIAGGLLNQVGQRKADERANQYAREAQERANQQNIQFWNMQNEYNNPSAQMARMRNAGLNPNLMYGNSQSGGAAQQIASAKPADTQSNKRNFDIQAAAQLAVQGAQTDNLRATNTVLEKEAALREAQTAQTAAATAHESIKTARTKFDLDIAEALKQTSLSAAKVALQNLEEEYYNKQALGHGLRLDNSFKEQTLNTRIKQIHTEGLYAVSHLKGQNLDNKVKELEIELNQLGINKGDALWERVLGRLINEALRYNDKK